MSTTTNVEHIYIEVGGEILDKTNALTAILECEGAVPTLLFCNGKADADVVEVVLKKRGISVTKPSVELPNPARVALMRQVQNKEVTVVAVTDSTGRGIETEHFEIVMNYSVPSEPEVFLHRVEPQGAECKMRKVYTLVGPQDQSNFQFIKKVAGIEFKEGQLPSAADLNAAKFKNLVSEAIKQELPEQEHLLSLVSLINAEAEKDKIIAVLLHNTLNVIPSLKKVEARPQQRQHSSSSYDDDRSDRRVGGRRRDRRGGRSRSDDDGDYIDHSDREARDSDRSDRRGPRPPMAPPIVETRFYVGHGSRDGFSQDKLNELMQSQCGLPADSVKRFSLRDRYSFFDVSNDVAESVSSKLSDASVAGDDKLFLRKATVISIRNDRPESGESEAPSETAAQNSESTSEGSENGSSEAREVAASAAE